MWLISYNIQTVWSALHFQVCLQHSCNNQVVALVAKTETFVYPLSKKRLDRFLGFLETEQEANLFGGLPDSKS
jgi:hypothetical protein